MAALDLLDRAVVEELAMINDDDSLAQPLHVGEDFEEHRCGAQSLEQPPRADRVPDALVDAEAQFYLMILSQNTIL